MRRILKECKPFEKSQFYEFVRDEFDNALISYDGRDYMFDRARAKEDGQWRWYLMDAVDHLTERKPRPLFGPFESFESLVTAPILDGKSIDDRYDEIGKSDTFYVEYD